MSDFQHDTIFPALGGFIRVIVEQGASSSDREKPLSSVHIYFGYDKSGLTMNGDAIQVQSLVEFEPNPLIDLERLDRFTDYEDRITELEAHCKDYALKAVGRFLFEQEAEIDHLRDQF